MNRFEVRICISEKCNFNCRYCKPGGEGISNGESELTIFQLVETIKVLKQMGCSSVRLTGGEPLMRNDIKMIITELKKLVDVSLVTNGSMLNKKVVQEISEAGISSVTVSLDTLEKNKFKQITGSDSLTNVLNGIDNLLIHNIPTRINTVVSKMNIDEIDSIIEFGKKKNISVKLLDYIFYEHNEWNENYIELQPIINKLNQRYVHNISYPVGGFGTPMEEYEVGDIKVLVKDNMKGTCYSKRCETCKAYPCQSGVVSLVLTHNGYLKLCTTSDYISIDMKKIIQGENAMSSLEEFINNYQESRLLSLWKR